jgi:hypothetical protein
MAQTLRLLVAESQSFLRGWIPGQLWSYFKVRQAEFTSLQPSAFTDLLVLKPLEFLLYSVPMVCQIVGAEKTR